MSNNLLPEGFRDDVSTQAAIEHKYLNLIIKLFQSYGYELVKTPLVEFTNQFNSKNTLNIKVKKNKKELSVRDDITMQIARLANARLSKKKRPLKLCYYGEVVRERPCGYRWYGQLGPIQRWRGKGQRCRSIVEL